MVCDERIVHLVSSTWMKRVVWTDERHEAWVWWKKPCKKKPSKRVSTVVNETGHVHTCWIGHGMEQETKERDVVVKAQNHRRKPRERCKEHLHIAPKESMATASRCGM